MNYFKKVSVRFPILSSALLFPEKCVFSHNLRILSDIKGGHIFNVPPPSYKLVYVG